MAIRNDTIDNTTRKSLLTVGLVAAALTLGACGKKEEAAVEAASEVAVAVEAASEAAAM